MNNYEDNISNILKENEALRKELEIQYTQNENKDLYINKLEEKISFMEKYIKDIEKENQGKIELYKTIDITKNEFEKLKENWSQKFEKLEKKYEKLKIKYQSILNKNINEDNIQTEDNIEDNYNRYNINYTHKKEPNKIDTYITKINEVSLNK